MTKAIAVILLLSVASYGAKIYVGNRSKINDNSVITADSFTSNLGSNYKRPGGTDTYRRPGGTDLYKRP